MQRVTFAALLAEATSARDAAHAAYEHALTQRDSQRAFDALLSANKVLNMVRAMQIQAIVTS